MKKMLLMAAVCLCMVVMSGCSSAYVTGYGFGSVMPGLLFSDQTRGTYMMQKLENLNGVEVLGPVKGESKQVNVLLIAAFGDGGIEAAKRDALKKYPKADDIVNVEVDCKHINFLPIINQNIMTLRGLAIKYKKNK